MWLLHTKDLRGLPYILVDILIPIEGQLQEISEGAFIWIGEYIMNGSYLNWQVDKIV